MSSRMTMRERMLEIVKGRPADRVPFSQYSNCGGPNEDVWALIGRGNMGILRGLRVLAVERPGSRLETTPFERSGLRGERTILRTPEGDLEQEKLFEPALNTGSIRRHFVRTPEDYRILNALLRSEALHEDLAPYRRELDTWGEDGLVFATLGRTPFQQLWIQWAGLEGACVHMAEAPQIVEETLALMAANQRRECEVVRAAVGKVPIPYVDFMENITAPVIGERLFRKYCVPQYDYMAELLEGTGILVCAHTDGDLKSLWNAIGESGLSGLESLTPPPDNDTSVAEAAARWPYMRLFVNFPSSVHLAEPEAVYRETMRLLEEGGHTGRMWIQISENVPPGAWRRSFPAIVQAIEDFGRPGG